MTSDPQTVIKEAEDLLKALEIDHAAGIVTVDQVRTKLNENFAAIEQSFAALAARIESTEE